MSTGELFQYPSTALPPLHLGHRFWNDGVKRKEFVVSSMFIQKDDRPSWMILYRSTIARQLKRGRTEGRGILTTTKYTHS